MDRTDIKALQEEFQQFLDIFQGYVESNSEMTWKPLDGFLPVVFRAILRRQFEGLQAISQLVATGNGFVAGPLLRPACEELIWAKYLTSISGEDAEQLVLQFALDERCRSLAAQDKFAGRPVTEALGLLPFLEESKNIRKNWLERIGDLGTRLDWPERSERGGRLPRMKWLAKATEEQSTYDFIYHATSRFVHFSVSELLRRAWGNPWAGTLSVNSIHFRDYWAHFCLHYSLLLFIRTYEALVSGDALIEIDEAKSDKIQEVMERAGKFGIPPMITAEELAWPTELT